MSSASARDGLQFLWRELEFGGELKRSWKRLVIRWIFSKGNCLIISLTTASSGPLTLLSLVLVLACSTRSTVISALRPSTVNCWSFFFSKCLNSVFLNFFRFLLIRVHFSTVPLQFLLPWFSVLCEIPFRIKFSQRFSFCLLLLPWFHAAFHQVISPCFPRLALEHSSLNFFRASCSSISWSHSAPMRFRPGLQSRFNSSHGIIRREVCVLSS